MNTEGLIRLHCKLFDFHEAQLVLEEHLDQIDPKTSAGLDEWLAMVPGALRIYGELENHEKIAQIKSVVLSLPEEKQCSQVLALKGRFLLQNQELEESLTCFTKALASAKTVRDKEHALFGLGMAHFYMGPAEVSYSYFQTLFESANEKEFKTIALTLMAQVRHSQKLDAECSQLFEKAKSSAREDRNLYYHIFILTAEAEVLMLRGEFMAAKNSIKAAEHFLPLHFKCSSHKKILAIKDKLESSLQKPGFELVESESKTTLKTPNAEDIDFSTQPILLKLFKVLAQTPRRAVSKEEIAENLWEQEYHPLHMDNKIYVTIRRLRKIVGDRTDQPSFILKKGDGYLLNPDFHFTLFQHKYFENPIEAR